MALFEHRRHRLSVSGDKVVEIKVEVIVSDLQAGSVWVTDLMLQAGEMATLWQPHPSELRWEPETP